MTKFYDTNALLLLGERAFSEKFCCSFQTFIELENIKSSNRKDESTKYLARKITKLLSENENYIVVTPRKEEIDNILTDYGLYENPDNIIMSCAKYYQDSIEQIIFITNDISCQNIAKNILGLETDFVKNSHEDYFGYKTVRPEDKEMAEIYTNPDKNIYDLKENEYLIIKNKDGIVVDIKKWYNGILRGISYSNITSKWMGEVKPRNLEQKLAMDLLQNKDIPIKVLTGKYGVGKDFLMISHAISYIERNMFEKIVWVRNTTNVKNSKEIGFLPGTIKEKLWPYCQILADHLGGEIGLENEISRGHIELEALNYIRGRSYKNSIIYCSEAENMTKEHIQLLIGRLGEGSQLWLNGDYKHQTDELIFETNNGLRECIEKLKGQEMFGCVDLVKTERSPVACLADLLD